MDETGITVEIEQPIISPPRRRRSTFFMHRESLAPQPANETNEIDIDNYVEQENYREMMSKYYDNLLSEKNQWKQEVNSRKTKYYNLRDKYQQELKKQDRSKIDYSDYSLLSKEDIDFLKSKPNIQEFVDCQQKLHKSVLDTMAFLQRAEELDNVVLECCEEKVQKITDYIIENSSIE